MTKISCSFLRVVTQFTIGFLLLQLHYVIADKDESLKHQLKSGENDRSHGKTGYKRDEIGETIDDTDTKEYSFAAVSDVNKQCKSKELKHSVTKKETEKLLGHLKKLGDHGSQIVTGEVEDIDYIPNGKDFYRHFVRKRRPLVMRGAASDWSAVKYWTNETYMRQKYGHVVFDVEFTKHYERIHPIKKTMNLSEYLDIYKNKQVYLDCPFPQSDMTADIMVPYCLQCEEVMSTITSIHLLYSSGNTSSSLHQDGYENLLTLISGVKEVHIANSSYGEYLYANNYTTVPGLSPVNPESVDLKMFPLVSEVVFHKVVLNAGDILYIPQHWWHHVRSFECPNIAISLWFHPFAEKEGEEVSLNEEEDRNVFEDMVLATKAFNKLVETYPETIKCEAQNKPITKAFHPSSDAWDTPREIIAEEQFITLASGYKIPKVGFGTAGLFKDTKDSVLVALTSGYRMIDSAQAYDEEQVGEAVKESGVPREEVFIVSKVHPRFLGFEETLKSVEESLTKLKVDYIDLMLIHSMDCDEGPGAHLICQQGEPKGTWEDSWKALESLVNKGKIRSIGVSNFEVEDLKRLLEIAKVRPSIVQNFFDPFNQDRATREFCEQNGIRYMGHSPLGDSWKREGLPVNPVLSDQGLRKIATKFDASIPQLVLKWSLEKDVIVIPRSRSPNHIKTNFQLTHVMLNEDDREYLESLDGKIIAPDDGPPFDSRSKPSVSDQETREEEKTADESARKKSEDIREKLVLIEEVDTKDSTLYLSSDDHWIYAFDSASGKMKWKYGTADEGGSKCEFNSDESVVYCGTDDKSLRALSAVNGNLMWKFSTEGAVTSSTRVGADGSLYFGCLDGYFYALNPDGSLKWKKDLAAEIWSSPALLEGGKAVFVGSMAEDWANVFSLDGETGEIIWKYKTAEPVFSSPSVSHDNNAVFFCSYDANCYAFNTGNGHVLWVFEADSAFQSSPVVSKLNGTLFVGSTEGNIYAVDSATGKLKWIREGKGELFSSPFVAPNGNVYIGSGEGEVLALRQTDGSLVWSFKTDSAIWSSPRLDKSGLLFIGGIDTYLYALRADDGQLVWKYKTDGPVVGTPLITREHAVQQA
ncbi:uncharacterized protein LOC111337205 isoform X2 [Stylophora pistillata]|uniref:uncharacterized protein LOC111337205 isoform X2 n=1 Tax=Stylophora pistillata TaxID=50429 RepID=UPI000C04E55C|nr:uncharacterized protein LOC111337205 isoform X2 [Stylophora pistillata]